MPRSFTTVHANVTVLGREDPSLLIEHNRSITFGSAVRKKPNCFTLLHQMQILNRLNSQHTEEVSCSRFKHFVQCFSGNYLKYKFPNRKLVASRWCQSFRCGDVLQTWLKPTKLERLKVEQLWLFWIRCRHQLWQSSPTWLRSFCPCFS